MLPSTLMSGRAPRGSAPSSATSTVTVPLRAAGSMRTTRPLRDAVARVDFGLLADGDILDLRLRDLQLRLQPRRIDDAREVRARADALPDLHRHFLQHARNARANLQARRLRPPQRRHRLAPLHFGLLHGQLHRERALAVGEPLLFHLLPRRRRFGEQASSGEAESRR